MDVKESIREFLMNELKDQGFHEGIRDDESLVDAGIMDSLGVLTTISFLEEKFGIIFSEDELDPKNFKSVDAIGEFAKKKLGQEIQ